MALKDGRRFDVKSPALKPFRSWDDLVEEAARNPTLDRLVQIIEDGRAHSVTRILADSTPLSRAKVCLMTAHRAKGLEFGHVKMAGDWTPLSEMAEKLEKAQAVSAHRLVQARQEYNVLYVAFTRAIARVEGASELL
jgi:superfamily I DNA/RNA helicase